MHKLVIQAPEVATQDLKQLAKLTKAQQIDAIHPQAFKLLGADPSTRRAVEDYCESAGLDFAFMPAEATLKDIGLVVMDMDSTLITIECIDEIADMLGVKAQVAAITERSMRGELDFPQSLRERVSLLAGLEESALEQVYRERLQLTPGAEKMLAAVHAAGGKSLLISGGFTFFTERLKAKLGLHYAVANTLEVRDGKLTGKVLGDIIDAQSKADWLVRLRTELQLERLQTIAIGDGANDLKMLAEAGYGIAFHAKPIVRAQAAYAINHCGLDGLLAMFG